MPSTRFRRAAQNIMPEDDDEEDEEELRDKPSPDLGDLEDLPELGATGDRDGGGTDNNINDYLVVRR